MDRLAEGVAAARPDLAVSIGYLEMSDPPAGPSFDALVAAGARRVVVLPVMLLAAGHAKSDVPAVVVEARLRHPDVEVLYGEPLGVHPTLVGIGTEALVHAGASGLPLVVVARGTSDPDANAEAHRATRLLAESTGAPFQVTGFSGVTTPGVPDALDMAARLGARRVALFAWFLCYGRLLGRIADDATAFSDRTGIEVVDAGWFGPDPRLGSVLASRYEDALTGRISTPCDLCVYRLPYPGREHVVGQPIGVGHSHLAVEHRH